MGYMAGQIHQPPGNNHGLETVRDMCFCLCDDTQRNALFRGYFLFLGDINV